MKSKIETALDKIFKEARGHLHAHAISEKQKQDDTADDLLNSLDNKNDPPAEENNGESNQEEPETSDDSEQHSDEDEVPTDDDKEKMADAEIEPGDIIGKINIIRSGKSFKDSQVKANMEKYVGDLKPAEKTALFAFLKGIAQIAVGDIPGAEALEPEDKPADVSMSKPEPKEKQTFHIEPNVVNNSPQEKEQAVTSSEEDTTPPRKLPISAKKRS